jgi:hypothetical protein
MKLFFQVCYQKAFNTALNISDAENFLGNQIIFFIIH